MTRTTEHTPGPWQVNDSTENDDDTTLTIFAPADEVEIATMSAYENGCECFSEIRANSHLIAAAPVMYEALKAIVGQQRPNRWGYDSAEIALDDEWRDQARAALAQAEGK